MRHSIFPIVFAALLAPVALAQQPALPRTISTAGEASVYVTPDRAVLLAGVQTFDPVLEMSTEENDAQSKRLVAALRAAGIEEKHIQTAHLDVEVNYRSANNYPIKQVWGYTARRSYAVTLTDVTKLEDLVQTVLGSGANEISSLEFQTTELRKHRDQARAMAINAAKEKAEALAKELGCSVGAPRSISEGGMGYFGYWGGYRGNAYMSQNSIQHIGGGGGAEGETMPVGQIAIRATISVVFDLIPAGDGQDLPAAGNAN